MLVISVLAAVGLAAQNASPAPVLNAAGMGTVRLGLTKPEALAGLSRLFGSPSARGVNTGCGPRYTEVEWGDLVAEFRVNTFSGFRYVEGGYPLTTPGSPRDPSPPKAPFPTLAAPKGVSLGSTLGRLRSAYGVLRHLGADMWRSPGGLVFVDDAQHDPEPASSRVVEIKVGTCGGF